MHTAIEFKAENRERTGKGGARALRRDGKVPAIVYAKGEQPINLAISEKELKIAYHKGSFFSKIVSIDAAGKSFQALPKDIQLHPVTDRIEHVDFMKVDDSSEIHVLVPVRFLNQDRSIGLKRGGVLNIVRHELELVCTPNNIPAAIEIDVANINIGESIHISHVVLPEKVRPSITDRDFTIATIAGRSSKDDSDGAGDAAAAAPAAAPEKK